VPGPPPQREGAVLLRQADPESRLAILESSDHVIAAAGDCHGTDIDLLFDEFLDKSIAGDAHRFRAKPDGVSLHAPARLFMHAVVLARRRGALVITITVITMFAAAPATWIAGQPGAVGVSDAVVPVPPGFHGRMVVDRKGNVK